MNSNISLKLYNLIKTGVIKSNAHFWKSFYNEKVINAYPCEVQAIKQKDMNIATKYLIYQKEKMLQ